MNARIIQLTAKPGRGKELANALVEKTLPLLKQQPGFVGALALNSENEQDKFVGISIWKTAQDADNWVRGKGRESVESIARPLLQQEPVIQSLNVEASTIAELSKGQSAGRS